MLHIFQHNPRLLGFLRDLLEKENPKKTQSDYLAQKLVSAALIGTDGQMNVAQLISFLVQTRLDKS